MQVKKIQLILALIVALLLLENCRRDPALHLKSNQDDPDSLYVGTKYSIKSDPAVEFILGNPKSAYADSMTKEGVFLGRMLFYEKHLSADHQKSCGSCHKLQYALSDSGLVLSTNEFGFTKRNTPSLINLAYNTLFFWDGRSPTASAQAADAFHNELGIDIAGSIAYLQGDSTYVKLFKKAFGRPGDITENKIFLAVQQFMFSAISCNSHFDRVMEGKEQFTNDEYNAFYNIFLTEKGDCFHCHLGANNKYPMVDNDFHNNGLDSTASIADFRDPGRGNFTGVSTDYGKFKTPTLRNIALTGPFMHDGRYKTLRQVIDFYSDSLQLSVNDDFFIKLHLNKNPDQSYQQHGGMHLSETEKQQLITLLNAFTDTSFINNPDLKDPF